MICREFFFISEGFLLTLISKYCITCGTPIAWVAAAMSVVNTSGFTEGHISSGGLQSCDSIMPFRSVYM
jgi:hypothetical protein